MPSNNMAKDFQPSNSETLKQRIGGPYPKIVIIPLVIKSNRNTANGKYTIGTNGNNINNNNCPPESHPVSQTTAVVPIINRAHESDPLEALEQGEYTDPTESTKICYNDTATHPHRDNLPIAMAVPIEGPHDNSKSNNISRNSKNSGPENAKADVPPSPTKDTQPTRANKPPSALSTSFLAGSLEPSPALKWILSILLGLTILLALGVIGILVARVTAQHQRQQQQQQHEQNY